MSRLLALTAAALAACGGSVSHPPATAPDRPDGVATQVRRAVEPLYAQEILHGGMVVALIEPTRDDGVTYLAFGHASDADAEPPGEDAIFEIGSVSKVLTSLLLADAVARGEVALDTPAMQLLPFGVRFPDRDGVAVTLAQLASHHSGLPSLPGNLDPSQQDPYATYGEKELFAYLERAELLFTPGTAYAYSNLGAGVLGHLLARKIGASYEQAVTTRVLAPLGLTETWIRVPDAQAKRVLAGHSAGGTVVGPWGFDALAGAGAWRSTPRDLVKLIRAATNAATGKDGPLAAVLRTSIEPLSEAGGEGAQIALAWHITDAGIVWHNGMTGGHSSFVGFDPKTNKGVVVLASTASPLITRLGVGVFEAYLGKELDLGLDLVEVPPAELDKLAGQYRLPDGTTLEAVRAGGALELVNGPERIRLYPRSPTSFVLLEIEASVDFAVEDGKVLGFVLHLPEGDVQVPRVEVQP